MFKLFVGSRWRDEVIHYECKGVYTSLSDAIWNFFDYKKSLTSKVNTLYGNSELHLTCDEDLTFDEDNQILLSAFNNLNGELVVIDNLKEYFDYMDYMCNKGEL